MRGVFERVLEADEFGASITKGVAWSPDGTCLLTASDDDVVRLFEVPQQVLDAAPAEGGAVSAPRAWPSTLKCCEGETVYDYAWYPQMHSSNPVSCCFLSTSRDHPLHLWDAFDGSHRATYRGNFSASAVLRLTSKRFWTIKPHFQPDLRPLTHRLSTNPILSRDESGLVPALPPRRRATRAAEEGAEDGDI
ncbi:hypothetical protein M885DRAFT_183950 [Pelagophyceae sp. CCMP2097]|nr:hypothetical protein M885DRAFT_183950 [Pelagophyceae sp. CCMP2097]